MGKRLMIAVVGAGIGALAGLLVDYLGAGTPALWAGAAAGALIPQFVLGRSGTLTFGTYFHACPSARHTLESRRRIT